MLLLLVKLTPTLFENVILIEKFLRVNQYETMCDHRLTYMCQIYTKACWGVPNLKCDVMQCMLNDMCLVKAAMAVHIKKFLEISSCTDLFNINVLNLMTIPL